MLRIICNFTDHIMTFSTCYFLYGNLFYYHLANKVVWNLKTFFN